MLDGVCKPVTCQSGYELYDNGGIVVCILKDKNCTNDLCTNSNDVGILQRCDSSTHELGTPQICPNSYSCNSDNTGCGECKNDVKICSNIDGVGQLTTCSNGTPSTSSCENNFSCNSDNTDCGECKNDVTSCSDNSEYIGQLTTCSNGTLITSSCENNFSCNSDNTGCGDCKNDVTSCSDSLDDVGLLTICSNGTISTSSCPDNHSCKDDKCGSCHNGEMLDCHNLGNGAGVYKICTGGAPFQNGNCGNRDKSCSSLTSCGECLIGKTRCTGDNAYQTCVDGLWSAESTPCPDNETCSDGVCSPSAVCSDGDTRCENEGNVGKIQTCNSGEWSVPSSCNNDYSCSSPTTCGVCKDGVTTCMDESDVGKLTTCSGGKLNTTICGGDDKFSCLDSSTCGVCQNNDTKCADEHAYQQCVGGVWGEDSVLCESSQTCSEGECKCSDPYSLCGGICVNTTNDLSNCGGCGLKCSAYAPANTSYAVCQNGLCQYTCSSGYADCGGTGTSLNCVDIQSNREHCGACNNACNPNQICTEGACKNCLIGDSCTLSNCQRAQYDSTCNCKCERCDAGYHLNNDGTCKPNSPTDCGSAIKSNAVNCDETVTHYSYAMTCNTDGNCMCLSTAWGSSDGKICDCTKVFVDGKVKDFGYRCAQNCMRVSISGEDRMCLELDNYPE